MHSMRFWLAPSACTPLCRPFSMPCSLRKTVAKRARGRKPRRNKGLERNARARTRMPGGRMFARREEVARPAPWKCDRRLAAPVGSRVARGRRLDHLRQVAQELVLERYHARVGLEAALGLDPV